MYYDNIHDPETGVTEKAPLSDFLRSTDPLYVAAVPLLQIYFD